MPFDPAVPAADASFSSAAIRAQFVALKELLDAIPAGPAGPQGEAGAPGEPGPPFAASVVDAVFTVPFGDPAAVTSSFDGSAVHFTFHIPAGQPGAQGQEGAAGEVSAVQLADAIATTAQNPASLPAFSGTVSDPPTQAEVQAVIAYVESLRQVLAR